MGDVNLTTRNSLPYPTDGDTNWNGVNGFNAKLLLADNIVASQAVENTFAENQNFSKDAVVNRKLETAGTLCLSGVQEVSVGLGVERLSNPGFDTDTIWTKGSFTTITGGKAILSGAGAYVDQAQAFVSGTTYRVGLTVDSVVPPGSTCQLEIWIGAWSHIETGLGVGTHTFDVVAGASSETGHFTVSRVSGAITIDNATCKELTNTVSVTPTHSVINVTNTTPDNSDITVNLSAGSLGIVTPVKVYYVYDVAHAAARLHLNGLGSGSHIMQKTMVSGSYADIIKTVDGWVGLVFDSDANIGGSLVINTTTLVANLVGYENKVGVGTATPERTLHILGGGWPGGSGTPGVVMMQDDDGRKMVLGAAGLWRHDLDADNGSLVLNPVGYNNGVTRFRDVRIQDGKAADVLVVDGSAASVSIGFNLDSFPPLSTLCVNGGVNIGGSGAAGANNLKMSSGIISMPQSTTGPLTWQMEYIGAASVYCLNIKNTQDNHCVIGLLPGGAAKNSGIRFYYGDLSTFSSIIGDNTKLEFRDVADVAQLQILSGSVNVVNSLQVAKRILGAKGADVASANDVTLGDGNYFEFTGTTTINRILTTGWTAGSTVVCRFTTSLTVAHNVASGSGYAGILITSDGADLAISTPTVLTLVYNGTNWIVTGKVSTPA